jgi:hypothetical protein
VKIPDQEMFGVVQAFESSAPYAPKDACLKNDGACAMVKMAIEKTEIATVDVMGLGSSNLSVKVVVPRAHLAKGDIIKLRTPPANREKFADILGIGARKAERKSGSCDWERGSPDTYRGGVECNGWSYTSLQLPFAPPQ